MKTKLKRFGAWLMAVALAFAGAGAYGATKQVANQTDLNAAVAAAAAGDVIEITAAGTYKVPSPTSAIKIVGVDGVVFNAIDTYYGQSVGQATGTEFENVKFAFGSSLYTGFQHSSYVAFTKCSFTGRFNSYGEMHFTECSFEAPSSDYSMWLYAGDTYFKDCTFSGNGKFFNIYNEGNTAVPWIVEFDGCSFESTTSNKAALNVKSTCGSKGLKYDVRVNNCKLIGDNFPAASASDSLIVFNGLIQLDDIKASVANEITITQDGKVLYADNAVAGPEVAIKKPTKEEVAAKTEGEATPEQKTVKAEEVVAVIAEAVEKEALEVSKSGLSAAGKTADGKLADPLVTALKTAAGEEKKDEITNETKVKKTIDVVFMGMTVEAGEKVTTTKLAYDVTPKATATLADGTEVKAAIPNGTFGKINFRMPLTADFAGRWLKVSRTDNGTDFVDVGLYQAQKEGDVDFVQVAGDHFTTYVNEISDVTPVASINGKGYTSLADALKAVQPGETIKLVAEAEWNDANQIRATGFTLTSDGERKKINVKKTMLFGGDNIKLDNIEFAADFYDEISMVSCNTGRKTSFEVSNCKFTGFYYSTSFQPIGCAKITNCEFKNGFRAIGWAYAYGDGVDIENCKISGVTYGIHFDGGDAPVRVKNCEIAAWSSYGGISSMSFEGCKFKSARYNCVPAYVDTTFVNCEFDSDFECYAQATGFHWTFSGCKFGGAEFTESVLKENFEDSDVWEKCLLTIDGDKVRHTTESAAVKYVADPTDWLAEGYCAKQGTDGKWTVAESVAEIVGGRQYDTLAKALAAVGNGQTIKVLKSGNVVTEYPKQIGEDGYSEKDGYNRLIFGTDAAFTLDLNGQTLTGRINFTKGDMTVSNGTLKATSQVLNVFGRKTASSTEEAAAPYTKLTIAADCSVEGGNFGVAVFGGDQGNIYWPLGFGETVNIYGKIKALYSPIQTSGNVGMDTYVANIGKNAEVEAVTNALKMGVSAMMAKYGSVVNIYDGAVLETVPGKTEDSSQGISSQGMATYNIYGGKISGAEAIGVKGGIVNVMGGEITAVGVKANPIEAVNSGTEVSGGGIAISTSYNGNYPIIVNVTGGTVKSANNAAFLFEHSWTFDEKKQPKAPCPVVQGVRFAVSGGTFIGAKDELAIKVEDAIEGDASVYPANFIEPEMDGDDETGFPLCSSRIPAEYIAVGYVEKDNKNGTWTVTKGANGSAEVQTKDISGEPEVKPQEGSPELEPEEEAEAKEQAAEIKENIVKAMTDPEVNETTGTGVKEAIKDGDRLKDFVVTAINEALADRGIGETIDNTNSNVDSYVEIQLEGVEVSAKVEMDEQSQHVVKTELNKVTYDIKPILTIVTTVDDVKTTVKTPIPENTVLNPAIKFRLWLDESFKYDVATVIHVHGNEADTNDAQYVDTENGRKYIKLAWNKFSQAIVFGSMSSDYACRIDNTPYASVAEAIAADTTGSATIYLLQDCDEEGLSLKADQKIVKNGHAVTHSVGVPEGKESVTTKDGEIYAAEPKIDVPVGTQGNGVPIRGFDFTGTPAAELDKYGKGDYLAETSDNGNFRWQNYVLFGSDAATAPKLIPQIVKAATGFSGVQIKAQDGYAVNTPEKCGVGVKFQLMRSDASASTGFVLVGEPKVEPVFAVDVKEIGVKTFWKIQTIFETTEDLPTQAPTAAN